jgi:coenzyme F420-reducing hydrogenase alpha subunit
MGVALAETERQDLLKKLTDVEGYLPWFAKLLRGLIEKNSDLIDSLGDIRTGYMGLMHNGAPGFYQGDFHVIKEDGSASANFKPSQYFNYVEEQAENWSYMKFPVLKSGERFRVGPLARINIADKMPTPMANQELEWFRQRFGRPAHKTLAYHYARLIEVVYAFERCKELLNDSEITEQDIFTTPVVKAGVGVGAVEAPRGTLIHRYELDGEGKATKVDLYVATQHNNYGFNDALKETAAKLITNANPDNNTLNKLEMIVRAYDPCLSCSTHYVGDDRAFTIELVDYRGNLVKEWKR